jgi:hypothetical protein
MEEAQRFEIPTRCQLLIAVRDRSGKVRFRETPEIIREVCNLGRRMFLVRFDDGETTFLFPNEVATTGTTSRERFCR